MAHSSIQLAKVSNGVFPSLSMLFSFSFSHSMRNVSSSLFVIVSWVSRSFSVIKVRLSTSRRHTAILQFSANVYSSSVSVFVIVGPHNNAWSNCCEGCSWVRNRVSSDCHAAVNAVSDPAAICRMCFRLTMSCGTPMVLDSSICSHWVASSSSPSTSLWRAVFHILYSKGFDPSNRFVRELSICLNAFWRRHWSLFSSGLPPLDPVSEILSS